MNRKKKETEAQYEEFRKLGAIPIPYAFVTGGVNVADIFYLKENVEDSYTDGVFAGVIVTSYHLSKKKAEISPSDPTGAIKVGLRINFDKKKLEWRFCNKNWNFKWKCHGWNKLIDF